MTRATKRALADSPRTALAEMALLLARRIDAGPSEHALVALVREHKATLAAALRVPTPWDPVDELRERRARRRRG